MSSQLFATSSQPVPVLGAKPQRRRPPARLFTPTIDLIMAPPTPHRATIVGPLAHGSHAEGHLEIAFEITLTGAHDLQPVTIIACHSDRPSMIQPVAATLAATMFCLSAFAIYRSPWLGVAVFGPIAMFTVYWWGCVALEGRSMPPPSGLLKVIASASRAFADALRWRGDSKHRDESSSRTDQVPPA